MQIGAAVDVVFFGEHAVRGIVEDLDEAKAMIVFGRGAWTVTIPRQWIQQRNDNWVIDLG